MTDIGADVRTETVWASALGGAGVGVTLAGIAAMIATAGTGLVGVAIPVAGGLVGGLVGGAIGRLIRPKAARSDGVAAHR